MRRYADPSPDLRCPAVTATAPPPRWPPPPLQRQAAALSKSSCIVVAVIVGLGILGIATVGIIGYRIAKSAHVTRTAIT